MAKLNFNVRETKKTITQKPKTKPQKIELEKHVTSMTSNEKYVYVDESGIEQQYTGIMTKTGHSAYGKIYENHEVELTYYPEVKHVDHQDEYFTYKDENGDDKEFKGKVEFDLERNTYVGVIRNKEIKEQMIQIFEEK